MSIDIGIIGLAQSGKTTIFNTLTGGTVDTASHAPDSMKSHLGIARIPDPRLQNLAEMLHPQKLVPVEARYIDVGASVRSMAKDKGIGGELLNQLSQVDALINVVRAFVDDRIPHSEGSLDVKRDMATMDLELAFSDLSIIERRLERIEHSLKGAKPPERQVFDREQEFLLRLKAELENEVPIRELSLTDAETKTLANYQFLTAKPLLIVVNIGEDQLQPAISLEAELNAHHSRKNCHVIALCGKLEMELSQLDNDAATEFRADFGITESGIDRALRQSYELLDLINFFTTASGEVSARAIKTGTTALNAAGKIHSDMERGFIRAEVISYDDLTGCGSLAEARKKGLLRLEGKDYIVQDGDVITFLFNV